MCFAAVLFAPPGCRVDVAGVIISVIILYLGIGLLVFSQRGRIKILRIPWGVVRGKSAKYISTAVALWFISLSVLGILSAIFGWGCPRAQ
ncbi:MAG TPA: hypothetical protein VK388_11785 [Pyrinomonadaceae bacterium]|nr:hypothetical protein [Pyrinomonadaceae bacterium]